MTFNRTPRYEIQFNPDDGWYVWDDYSWEYAYCASSERQCREWILAQKTPSVHSWIRTHK